ncbi:hypothetical protein Tco_1469057, partial [Tanacetum coccineum]
MKHPTSSTNLHSTNTTHTRMSIMEEALTWALIAKQEHPSMIRVPVPIKILVMTNLHFILRVSHNSSTVVRSVKYPIDQSPPQDLDFESHFNILQRDTNRILEELLRTLKPNSLVEEHEGSDDYTQVPFNNEQILRQHYTAHVMPLLLAYTPPPHFLITMESTNTLLMGGEVISTIPAREIDEFIKFIVDDLVPIPRESEVTSDSNLECDMLVNTPFSTTDVREENFDINSPLRERGCSWLAWKI